MDMQKHKAKSTAKSHPPAFYRYREKHPTMSITLTKELKDLLDVEKQKDDLPYSHLISKIIKREFETFKGSQERHAKESAKASREAEKKRLDYGDKQYNRGFDAGKTSALKNIPLGVCTKCGKPVPWDLTNPRALKMFGDLLRKEGLSCDDCNN